MVAILLESERVAWNDLVAQEPSFALMQSWEWGEFKTRLGWKAFRVAVEEKGRLTAGAQMLIRPLPLPVASVAYVPRGPVGNWLEEGIAPRLLAELHRLAQQHRAVFLKVELPLAHDPHVEHLLQRYHFRPARYASQPRATIVVDLMPDLDQVLAQMSSKTRTHIRHGARKLVTVRVGGVDDLATLNRLMQITGRRAGFVPRRLEYFEQQWRAFAPLEQLRLSIASYRGEAIAANVTAVFGEHAASLHGASCNQHRDLSPNHMLVWEAIRWAKSRGCRTFDLWGIPEQVGLAAYEGHDTSRPDRTDGLWGVYGFKRGFGGNVVLYAKSHDYVYRPTLYRLITNQFFVQGGLDRIAAWIDALDRSRA